MTPTGQTSEIIRKQFPTRSYSVTADESTTAIVENAGLGMMWLQCAGGTLGTITITGSLEKDGVYEEPTVETALTTLGESAAPVALPPGYYGLPYLKITADSGSHTILVGGAG